jgi:hypothetical protein
VPPPIPNSNFEQVNPLFSLTSKRDPTEKRQHTYLLHIAAEKQNLELVNLLFRYHVSPNLLSLQGESPRFIATRELLETRNQNGCDIINALLENGAMFTKETDPLLQELEKRKLWYNNVGSYRNTTSDLMLIAYIMIPFIGMIMRQSSIS